MRTCTGNIPVKTACLLRPLHFCYEHLNNFGFGEKKSYFVICCSIAPKRFVAELSSNERKYAPMHAGVSGENRICVSRTPNFWRNFFHMWGLKTKIYTFSVKSLPLTHL